MRKLLFSSVILSTTFLVPFSSEFIGVKELNAAAFREPAQGQSRKPSNRHFRELPGTSHQLATSFCERALPEMRSQEEILTSARVQLGPPLGAEEQLRLAKAINDANQALLKEYNSSQIILQNIAMSLAKGDRTLREDGDLTNQFIERLAQLKRNLLELVWDDYRMENYKHMDMAREGEIQLDYLLHYGSLACASLGWREDAIDLYDLSMTHPDALSLQPSLRFVEHIGTNAFVRPKEATYLSKIPEEERHKSRFGLLTLLHLVQDRIITPERLLEELPQFLGREVPGGPVKKVYNFISPEGEEIPAFKKMIKAIKRDVPEEVQSQLQDILQLIRSEKMRQLVKSGDLDQALREAPNVWLEIQEIARHYNALILRGGFTSENIHHLRNEEFLSLGDRALEYASELNNFTGADFLNTYQEFAAVKDSMETILREAHAAFPEEQEITRTGESPIIPTTPLDLPDWSSVAGESVTAEAKKVAREVEARRKRKQMAKKYRDNADPAGARTTVAATEAAPVDEETRRAIKKAQKSRKKVIKNLKDKLPEQFEPHREQIQNVLAALQAAHQFDEINIKLAENGCAGANFEFVNVYEGRELRVWSLRVNRSIRITFKISVLDDVEQMNPLRITDLHISNHYDDVPEAR